MANSSPKITYLRRNSNRFMHKYLLAAVFDNVLNLGCGSDNDKQGQHYADYFQWNHMSCFDSLPLYGITDVGSAESLPYEDNSFDFVFCNWLLYKEQPISQLVLAEIKRVLVPRGRVLLSYWRPTIPTFGALKELVTTYIQPTHVYTQACMPERDQRKGIAQVVYGHII